MEFKLYDFRDALAVLRDRPDWDELVSEIRGITRSEVLKVQAEYRASGKRVPAGAQKAVNEVFRRRLVRRRWKSEVPLFPAGGRDHARWKFDFRKQSRPRGKRRLRLGVEVTFNHAEPVAWTLVRLNLASESTEVIADSRIDVGVAIYPTPRFKRWGRMDGTVGTYERACLWLEMMKPVMPSPIVIIGLDPTWRQSNLFRGTRKGTRS